MDRNLNLYRELLLTLEENLDPDGPPVQIHAAGGLDFPGENEVDWEDLEEVEPPILLRHVELMA